MPDAARIERRQVLHLPQTQGGSDLRHVEFATDQINIDAVQPAAASPPAADASSASFASCASFNTRQPPSAVMMFLFTWKLNETISPNAPIRRPFQLEPIACAASSTTRSERLFASPYNLSMSQGSPHMCTGISARVREVTASAALSISRL